jgi:hypothetical protein
MSSSLASISSPSFANSSPVVPGQNAQQRDFATALHSGQQTRSRLGADQRSAASLLPPRLTLSPPMRTLANRYLNIERPQRINYEQARRNDYPAGAPRPVTPISLEHGHRTVTAEQALAMAHGQLAMNLARSVLTPVNQYIPSAKTRRPLYALVREQDLTWSREVLLQHALQCGVGNCQMLSSLVFDYLAASPEMKHYGIQEVVSLGMDHAVVVVKPPGGASNISLDSWVAFPTAGLTRDVNADVDVAGAADAAVGRFKPPGQIIGSGKALGEFLGRNMARRPTVVRNLSAGIDAPAERRLRQNGVSGVSNIPFSHSPNLTYQVPGKRPFTMNYVYPPR